MPKIVDHDYRSKDIINQALEIFSRKGYYSANYEEIAEKCGLSRTGLYKYYANKEAIFIETVRYVVDSVTGKLHDVVQAKSLSSSQRLKEVLSVFADFMKSRNFSSVLLEFTVCMNHDQPLTVTQCLQESIKSLWTVTETVFASLGNSSSYAFSLAFMGLSFFQNHILQPLFGTVEGEGDRYTSLLEQWESMSNKKHEMIISSVLNCGLQ